VPHRSWNVSVPKDRSMPVRSHGWRFSPGCDQQTSTTPDRALGRSAGDLGRQWLPSHRSIDGADLAIAATVLQADAHLLTRNVQHFPMLARYPY